MVDICPSHLVYLSLPPSLPPSLPALQAADIVQALQRACRSASKAQRSSGHVPVSFQRHSSVGDSPRVAMHRSFMEDEDEIIEHKPIFSLSRRESKKVLARNRVSVESPTISRPASLTDPVRYALHHHYIIGIKSTGKPLSCITITSH